MKKKVCIRQQDMTDCGAACLASVSAFYKLRIPVARIRQMASTDAHGTNIMGMIEAAEKLGFHAKGMKGPYESLSKIPVPSILHVIVNKQLHHFVVLYGLTRTKAILMDPYDGKIHRKTHEELRKVWTGILILLVPSAGFKPGNSQDSVAERFLALLLPHKSVLLQSFFGAVVYNLLGIATSVYIKNVVDHVLVQGNLNLLALMSLAMIVILVVKTYLNIMKGILTLKLGQHFDAMLVMGYYKHLLRLPQRFFDGMKIGEIVSRINDAVKIRAFISNVSLDYVVNALIVILTLIVMFVFSWKLAFIVVAGVFIYGGIYWVVNSFNKRFLRRIMENAAALESHFIESLDHIVVIKHFGAETHASLKSEVRFVRLLKSSYGSLKQSILSTNASDLISGGLIIGIIWAGSSLVISQDITSGMLVSFYALLGYLTIPVNNLIRANHALQDAWIAADRLFQIMDLEHEADHAHTFELTRDAVGDIHFHHISFRYGTRVQVFKDLCLILPKGMTTAIVGESGSGKTSLVSLLLNLYPIQSGSIQIGKYNLRQISNQSLRKLIGIVPQSIELFNGSVMENIAFGSQEPDIKRMVDVCDLLQMRSFVENLPQGFQTCVGEHGVALSGGERQRIAIARALYHDPEILILDEATSALDSDSEKDVRKVIDFMKKERKTVVVIAHRLSTVMHADKICVLKHGTVVEEGQHSELLRKKGHYYHMWEHQIPILEDLTVF